jgi:hypothetical protein
MLEGVPAFGKDVMHREAQRATHGCDGVAEDLAIGY